MKTRILFIFFSICSTLSFAQPRNIAVYRYGDGALPLGNSTTATFIDEYSTDGTFIKTIAALPTTKIGDNNALTGIGTSTQEGTMTLSADRKYLMVMGFNLAPGATNFSTAARVLGRIHADGSINTSTVMTNSTATPRAAVSVDGTEFWFIGSGSSVRYIPLGGTNGVVLGSPTGNFGLQIFNNQLYLSTTSRVAAFGSGLPKTATQNAVNIPGYSTTGSPYSFTFLDSDGDAAPDILYVADDNAGQIQKHVFNGTSWERKGNLTVAGVTERIKSITASVENNIVTGFVTTIGNAATSTPSALLKFTNNINDDLSNASPLSTIAVAPANTIFKSVSFAPRDESLVKAPGNLSSTVAEPFTSVALTWKDNSDNEINFAVERSTNGIDFTILSTLAANTTTFTDTDLAPGLYYYRVRAIGAIANSAYSNIVVSDTDVLPAAPSVLFGVPLSSSATRITWVDNAEDEIGYIIERSEDGVTFSSISTVYGANVSTFTDVNLQPSTRYFYRVKAISLLGSSGYSNIGNAATLSNVNGGNYRVSNVLTPNGDGINDKWIITDINNYPDNEVKVFDRSGRMVYRKKGYSNEWEGTVNGHPLIDGAYFYIIDFGSGEGQLKGSLSIVRNPQ